MTVRGRQFWKMSGSGNDFIFFDAMRVPAGPLAEPATIGRLCERRTGIGADGVVFLEPQPGRAFFMRYFNRDGSLAEMCGNAALCSTRLARDLGIVLAGDFAFETVSGPVTGRFVDGRPEIDMVPVTELKPEFVVEHAEHESRVGYARVGVPHLVVMVDDLDAVDVPNRGRVLRYHPALRAGANANFVGRNDAGQWAIRTYERGVEEETLACGTGAVAAAALLNAWGLATDLVALTTKSGSTLQARVPSWSDGAAPADGISPVLRGEGRVVFEGFLGEF